MCTLVKLVLVATHFVLFYYFKSFALFVYEPPGLSIKPIIYYFRSRVLKQTAMKQRKSPQPSQRRSRHRHTRPTTCSWRRSITSFIFSVFQLFGILTTSKYYHISSYSKIPDYLFHI